MGCNERVRDNSVSGSTDTSGRVAEGKEEIKRAMQLPARQCEIHLVDDAQVYLAGKPPVIETFCIIDSLRVTVQ